MDRACIEDLIPAGLNAHQSPCIIGIAGIDVKERLSLGDAGLRAWTGFVLRELPRSDAICRPECRPTLDRPAVVLTGNLSVLASRGMGSWPMTDADLWAIVNLKDKRRDTRRGGYGCRVRVSLQGGRQPRATMQGTGWLTMEGTMAILVSLVFPMLVWTALIAALVCVVRDCMRDKSLDKPSPYLVDDSRTGASEPELPVCPRLPLNDRDGKENNAWVSKRS
jgi:hypothetical protein